MSDEIPVEIKGLVPTPAGTGVFLGHGDKVITIFIDAAVAMAITMLVEKIERPRPLTHDLISSIFLGLGIRATRVLIHDLKDGTFYARLHLVQENESSGNRRFARTDQTTGTGSQPLALEQKCPVFVTRAVWDAAEDMSWALGQGDEPPAKEGKDDAEPPGDAD
ncbi:MAG: bifunctional nuclease family protein [Kiritimatiellia bacterium]